MEDLRKELAVARARIDELEKAECIKCIEREQNCLNESVTQLRQELTVKNREVAVLKQQLKRVVENIQSFTSSIVIDDTETDTIEDVSNTKLYPNPNKNILSSNIKTEPRSDELSYFSIEINELDAKETLHGDVTETEICDVNKLPCNIDVDVTKTVSAVVTETNQTDTGISKIVHLEGNGISIYSQGNDINFASHNSEISDAMQTVCSIDVDNTVCSTANDVDKCVDLLISPESINVCSQIQNQSVDLSSTGHKSVSLRSTNDGQTACLLSPETNVPVSLTNSNEPLTSGETATESSQSTGRSYSLCNEIEVCENMEVPRDNLPADPFCSSPVAHVSDTPEMDNINQNSDSSRPNTNQETFSKSDTNISSSTTAEKSSNLKAVAENQLIYSNKPNVDVVSELDDKKKRRPDKTKRNDEKGKKSAKKNKSKESAEFKDTKRKESRFTKFDSEKESKISAYPNEPPPKQGKDVDLIDSEKISVTLGDDNNKSAKPSVAKSGQTSPFDYVANKEKCSFQSKKSSACPKRKRLSSDRSSSPKKSKLEKDCSNNCPSLASAAESNKSNKLSDVNNKASVDEQYTETVHDHVCRSARKEKVFTTDNKIKTSKKLVEKASERSAISDKVALKTNLDANMTKEKLISKEKEGKVITKPKEEEEENKQEQRVLDEVSRHSTLYRNKLAHRKLNGRPWRDPYSEPSISAAVGQYLGVAKQRCIQNKISLHDYKKKRNSMLDAQKSDQYMTQVKETIAKANLPNVFACSSLLTEQDDCWDNNQAENSNSASGQSKQTDKGKKSCFPILDFSVIDSGLSAFAAKVSGGLVTSIEQNKNKNSAISVSDTTVSKNTESTSTQKHDISERRETTATQSQSQTFGIKPQDISPEMLQNRDISETLEKIVQLDWAKSVTATYLGNLYRVATKEDETAIDTVVSNTIDVLEDVQRKIASSSPLKVCKLPSNIEKPRPLQMDFSTCRKTLDASYKIPKKAKSELAKSDNTGLLGGSLATEKSRSSQPQLQSSGKSVEQSVVIKDTSTTKVVTKDTCTSEDIAKDATKLRLKPIEIPVEARLNTLCDPRLKNKQESKESKLKNILFRDPRTSKPSVTVADIVEQKSSSDAQSACNTLQSRTTIRPGTVGPIISSHVAANSPNDASVKNLAIMMQMLTDAIYFPDSRFLGQGPSPELAQEAMRQLASGVQPSKMPIVASNKPNETVSMMRNAKKKCESQQSTLPDNISAVLFKSPAPVKQKQPCSPSNKINVSPKRKTKSPLTSPDIAGLRSAFMKARAKIRAGKKKEEKNLKCQSVVEPIMVFQTEMSDTQDSTLWNMATADTDADDARRTSMEQMDVSRDSFTYDDIPVASPAATETSLDFVQFVQNLDLSSIFSQTSDSKMIKSPDKNDCSSPKAGSGTESALPKAGVISEGKSPNSDCSSGETLPKADADAKVIPEKTDQRFKMALQNAGQILEVISPKGDQISETMPLQADQSPEDIRPKDGRCSANTPPISDLSSEGTSVDTDRSSENTCTEALLDLENTPLKVDVSSEGTSLKADSSSETTPLKANCSLARTPIKTGIGSVKDAHLNIDYNSNDTQDKIEVSSKEKLLISEHTPQVREINVTSHEHSESKESSSSFDLKQDLLLSDEDSSSNVVLSELSSAVSSHTTIGDTGVNKRLAIATPEYDEQHSNFILCYSVSDSKVNSIPSTTVSSDCEEHMDYSTKEEQKKDLSALSEDIEDTEKQINSGETSDEKSASDVELKSKSDVTESALIIPLKNESKETADQSDLNKDTKCVTFQENSNNLNDLENATNVSSKAAVRLSPLKSFKSRLCPIVLQSATYSPVRHDVTDNHDSCDDVSPISHENDVHNSNSGSDVESCHGGSSKRQGVKADVEDTSRGFFVSTPSPLRNERDESFVAEILLLPAGEDTFDQHDSNFCMATQSTQVSSKNVNNDHERSKEREHRDSRKSPNDALSDKLYSSTPNNSQVENVRERTRKVEPSSGKRKSSDKKERLRYERVSAGESNVSSDDRPSASGSRWRSNREANDSTSALTSGAVGNKVETSLEDGELSDSWDIQDAKTSGGENTAQKNEPKKACDLRNKLIARQRKEKQSPVRTHKTTRRDSKDISPKHKQHLPNAHRHSRLNPKERKSSSDRSPPSKSKRRLMSRESQSPHEKRRRRSNDPPLRHRRFLSKDEQSPRNRRRLSPEPRSNMSTLGRDSILCGRNSRDRNDAPSPQVHRIKRDASVEHQRNRSPEPCSSSSSLRDVRGHKRPRSSLATHRAREACSRHVHDAEKRDSSCAQRRSQRTLRDCDNEAQKRNTESQRKERSTDRERPKGRSFAREKSRNKFIKKKVRQ